MKFVAIIGIFVATVTACAAEQESESSISDDVATSSDSEVAPAYSVVIADCTFTTPYGVGMATGNWGPSDPPPTAAECTNWCTGTCRKSSGLLTVPKSGQIGLPRTWGCKCK